MRFLWALFALAAAQRSFIIDNDNFVKDGKIFKIFSGELHYSRVHPTYWSDRLLRFKAMGLNAVQTYVPWNFHEEVQGTYNFTGLRDLPAFLQAAQDADMLVLLRAGPYICGEWEFGGFPSWLLALTPQITLRTYETGYIAQVDKWWTVLLTLVEPYLYEHGGPIVMVQVENEYGSYGDVSGNANDKNYMEHLVSLGRQYLGNNIILYTTDGGSTSYMSHGTLVSEVYSVGDFGPGSDPMTSFNAQKQYNDPGKSPNMCSEYYTGWLTHWGEAMANTSSNSVATWLDKIIQLNGSFSLYMGHGGTNFGYWNGANGGGTTFQPSITSYDYDSPISEGGEHGYGPDGDKFVAIKNVLAKYVTSIPPEPAAIVKASYPTVKLTSRADFWSSLTQLSVPKTPFQVEKPQTLESLGFGIGGFALYSTSIPSATSTNNLTIQDYVRDRAVIYTNKVEAGTIYRPSTQTLGGISATSGQSLDLLVENMGRINYGHGMWDPKGISTDVLWNGKSLSTSGQKNWNITLLPFQWEQVNGLSFANSQSTTGPAFYRGTFQVSGTPHDTYVRLEKWSKGLVWVNGFNIGRYWEQQGPQHTLYLPAPFLVSGSNDIVVFELHQTNSDISVAFLNAPVFFTGQSCDPSDKAVTTSNVVAFHCDTTYNNNQEWQITSSGTIVLLSNSNLCLQEGPDNDPSSGYPNIEVVTCNGSKEQQFTYNSTTYELRSKNNNQCLDITGGFTSDGTNIETYPCSGGKNQAWTVDSAGHITSHSANQCVTVCPPA